VSDTSLRDCIIAILREYRQDLSYYDPCGPTFGVSEDDFEKVAERIIAEVKKAMTVMDGEEEMAK
jgi:hypothetical protein